VTRVNSITQAAAAARNHDAAITMRFATSLGKPACIYTHNIHAAMTLRSATTDSETPYCNYARMNNRTLQTPWRNPSHTSKRRQPQPPHTRAALHRRLQPLFPKKHNVSFSGFLPNKSHATFMQRLQCALQHHVHIRAAITMRFATARCRTPWRNQSHIKATAAATALHRWLQPLYPKKHNVSFSGFLPNTSPMQYSLSLHFPRSPLP